MKTEVLKYKQLGQSDVIALIKSKSNNYGWVLQRLDQVIEVYPRKKFHSLKSFEKFIRAKDKNRS